MYVRNYTTDNESVVFKTLVNVMDNNSDRILMTVDLVAAGALIIVNCCCSI
jgi:hypothetical protein